jgi:hypothetical protein
MYMLVAGILLTAMPAAAFADEVVVNGGFETAGSGGSTQSASWSTAASGGVGAVSERSTTSPRTGAAVHHISTLAGVNIGGNASVSQNSAANAISLQGGTTVSASFYAKYNFGPGGVGFRVLRVLNRSGAVVADSGLGVATAGTNGNYQNFTIGPVNVPAFGAAPNDAYYAFIELNVAAGAFAGSTAEGWIDDVSITGTVVGGAPTGACCIANVCSTATQAACTGTYQGNATTCTPDPCAPPVTGACCINNVCSVTTQAGCAGTYQNNGTTCNPDPCAIPITGACCTNAGACTVTTQAACTTTWRGASTVCIPNTCPIITEVCSNGGFEQGGFGGATDSFTWNTAVSGGPGSLSQRDGTMARTGGFAHHLLTYGADAIGGNAAVSQNSVTDGGMTSLQENTPLFATFHGKYILGPGGVGFHVLRILNGSGAIVLSTPLGVINAGTNGTYQTYTTATLTVPAFGAPPNDVYSAFIELNVAAGAFVGASAEAYIDDVSISGTLVTGGGPANGTCCRGSVCSITTQAACTAGANGGAVWSSATTCNDVANQTTPCCKADFNNNGSLAVQDIFDYLNAWFAGDATADFNGGGLAVQDIFDYLNAWFAGC